MMNTTTDIKQEALKSGLIWAGINLALFLVTWYAIPNFMTSMSYGIINSIIGICLAIFFCIDLRKKAGGYWTFSEALWPIFVMFLLSMGIIFIFNIVFGKFIDTSYPEKMKELVMTNTESTFKSLGLSGEQADEALRKTADNLEQQFNPSFLQAIKGFGLSAIFYFIGAAIFALIFKKTNKNPFEDVNQANEKEIDLTEDLNK